MRWLVEVTALGKSDKESLTVDAESWQKALQAARAQRGDSAPMSGFSIELLDDGCRAVDPMSRLRYEVRKAPEGVSRSQPPRPAAQAAPRPAAAAVSAPAPAPAAAPAPTHAPAPAPPALPSQVIFKREQDATDAVPLTYREYVYLVPPGTTEAAAEGLLAGQLDLVKTSLERVAPGKLVNLGVFDVAFHGRPPVPPLATLSWKDWRGAPVIAFPRRGHARPAHAPAAHAAARQPAPAPAATVPVAALAAVAAAPAPVPAPVAFVPPPAFPEPIIQPMATPKAAPRARMRSEDLIADLFESMHDLHFVRDAVEGGEFCLRLAMEKLPCEAGVVHTYDLDRREFLVSTTRGATASALLLRRHTEGDPILHAAMRKQRAIVIPDAARSEASTLERYAVLGGARSLIVAPVIQHGRFLGAIEILNPLDGRPFEESEGNALTYIAEQFAEFISSHGVVTDPARISERPPPQP